MSFTPIPGFTTPPPTDRRRRRILPEVINCGPEGSFATVSQDESETSASLTDYTKLQSYFFAAEADRGMEVIRYILDPKLWEPLWVQLGPHQHKRIRRLANATLETLSNGLLAVENKTGEIMTEIDKSIDDCEARLVVLRQQKIMAASIVSKPTGNKLVDDARRDMSFSSWVQDDCEGGVPEEFLSERYLTYFMKDMKPEGFTPRTWARKLNFTKDSIEACEEKEPLLMILRVFHAVEYCSFGPVHATLMKYKKARTLDASFPLDCVLRSKEFSLTTLKDLVLVYFDLVPYEASMGVKPSVCPLKNGEPWVVFPTTIQQRMEAVDAGILIKDPEKVADTVDDAAIQALVQQGSEVLGTRWTTWKSTWPSDFPTAQEQEQIRAAFPQYQTQVGEDFCKWLQESSPPPNVKAALEDCLRAQQEHEKQDLDSILGGSST